jgi:ABC-type taurine transport system ATPase subunit
VAIARALVGDRHLLLADEPSGALDSVNGEAVMRMIHAACLAATFHDALVSDILILLIGLPLIAAVAGWLLAGREPEVIARQPLD